MKSIKKQLIVLSLAAVLSLSAFAGCGSTASPAQDTSKEDAADENVTAAESDASKPAEETDGTAEPVVTDPEDRSFTWLLDVGDSTFFDEYEDNPVARWWMQQNWDAYGDGVGQTITVDFITPPSGSETDNFSTLLATQEYPDVIGLNYSTASVKELYEEGVILDLTPYVEKYMPNYTQWIADHPEYEDAMLYRVGDEKKHLQIFQTTDVPGYHWGGYIYRRDWILKYGKNPETGAAFTGGYDADGDWTDDIVFPSGNTDPIYISDWEWMFEIFDEAMADLGLEDGYNMQLYYPGYLQTGDIACGFGGMIPWYYIDKDGNVQFGADSDGMRAYIECMASWYEKGWIDPSFDERTDIFFQIDSPSVYSGKVGCWYGLSSQLLDKLKDESNPALADICAYGAPQPINDIYGSDAEQNVMPATYFGAGGLLSNGVAVTEKAADKDLPTLMKAMDYFFCHDGGMKRSYGFSDKEQAEIQDEFYIENGLDNGAYREETNEDGETVYVLLKERNSLDGLGGAASGQRIPGNQINKNIIDETQTPAYKDCLDLWSYYDDIANGGISQQVSDRLTTEQANEGTTINNSITTYMAQAVAGFITGREDISDDAAWDAYGKELQGLGYQTHVDNLQGVID